jgi:hypothetical protein
MSNNDTRNPAPQRYRVCKDVITLLLAGAAAYGAIWIPLAIEKSSKETKAIEFLETFNDRITKVNYEIVNRLGKDKSAYTYDAISKNLALERDVFELLNEYEAFSYAVLHGVVSEGFALDLRGGPSVGTWERYEAYIAEYRKQRGIPDAWGPLELLVKKINAAKKGA